jgi:Ca2+-binding EF-hand superfamily protein
MKSITQNITMPRKTKRRLSLNQNASDVIPYSKVRVEWIDILSDSGWADEKGFDKMVLATPVNEGWLYKTDKKQKTIKLFASYDRDPDGTITFGDRTIIPLACVKKMTRIS